MADESSTPSTIAAVDLGSNSFHAVVARVVQGELQIVDRMRETVRLAAGLDHRRVLHADTASRALACLRKFGQGLRDVPKDALRAVGTSTLRRARNSAEFLDDAQAALGHSIEVISGREEARLIYLGVSHSIATDSDRRLCIDIGGGSTECILGEQFEPLVTDSLEMGCVSYTARFFADGDIKPQAFKAAETAAGAELQTIERRYRRIGWDTCIGASGTIGAIAAICHEAGWSRGGITKDGLDKLKKALLAAGKVAKLELPGLRPDRAAVLPAGVAVLQALFAAFAIDRMTAASGALREGVLYDLLGRIRHEDVRDRTVQALTARYHIDLEQAGRVERTALGLYKQAGAAWKLEGPMARQLLSWAAKLHEIGLQVAYSGYHKHGAYLAANGDLPGFSRDEQQLLAALIRNHRRKFALAEAGLAADKAILVQRMAVLLRLAVLLHRSRSSRSLPPVQLMVDAKRVSLKLPRQWLDEHPLTVEDLQQEVADLSEVGVVLVFGG